MSTTSAILTDNTHPEGVFEIQKNQFRITIVGKYSHIARYKTKKKLGTSINKRIRQGTACSSHTFYAELPNVIPVAPPLLIAGMRVVRNLFFVRCL